MVEIKSTGPYGSIGRQGTTPYLYPPDGELTTDSLRAYKSYKWSGNKTYEVRVALLKFDTSSIPDNAYIKSATLRLYVNVAYSANDRRYLNAEYFSYNTIDASCYTDYVPGTAFSVDYRDKLHNQYYALNNVHLINKTGWTGFRIGIDGGAPLDSNTWQSIPSQNDANGPLLLITYNITPTAPVVTAPNGGETYNLTCPITWQAATDAEGDSLSYHLQYSLDNGSTWMDIASGVTGTSYNWNTSTLPETTTALVRVRAYDGTSYSGYDQSNTVFTIRHNANPTISVASPSPNGTLQPGNMKYKEAA